MSIVLLNEGLREYLLRNREKLEPINTKDRLEADGEVSFEYTAKHATQSKS